jgi:hypothetical protein
MSADENAVLLIYKVVLNFWNIEKIYLFPI